LGRFCKLPTGVSQESGIPTFRDRQTDLWANFDAAELATPAAFDRDAESLPVEEWRRLRMPRVLPALLERAWP
jgi:NAD-dependent deacetylase